MDISTAIPSIDMEEMSSPIASSTPAAVIDEDAEEATVPSPDREESVSFMASFPSWASSLSA